MSASQFTLKTKNSDITGLGSVLLFNGQEIKNVTKIEVSSVLDGEDAIRTRLSIEIIGEVTTVE